MENKINDVLALVSLTEEGKIVLKQAMQLQKIGSCRIFVLNIIPVGPVTQHLSGTRKAERIKKEALEKLTDYLKGYYKGEIPENVIPLILIGNPVKVLIKQAQRGDFCIMILKRSLAKKSLPDLLDQNKLDKIIGNSHCPILCVNENTTPDELKNILIPIDITVNSEKKLLWASFFAKKTNAKIQIVSALNVNIDEKSSLASKNALKIKEMLSKRGIECEIEVLKVHDKVKHEVVLNYIELKKSDMVIIRKRQIATYTNPAIGEFAKEIIHNSPVPVFVVSQRQGDIENILQ